MKTAAAEKASTMSSGEMVQMHSEAIVWPFHPVFLFLQGKIENANLTSNYLFFFAAACRRA